MMEDDDDVPDELWDMLDTISHQKNQTVSQAPSMFQQQQQAPAAAVNHTSSIAGSTGPSAHSQWRPNLMQQLPLTAPPKPKSLAQQLLGDSSSSLARPGPIFPPAASTTLNNAQQRWTPPPQVQYPPPSWVSTPSTSTQIQRQGQQQQQQQQQWAGQQGPGSSTAGPPASASLAAELGLPPLQGPPFSATAAAGAAAGPGLAHAGGQQQQVSASEDVLRLQQEAERLRLKLMAAEREKQQLQQEKQHLQQRMTSQSQHSMAQHRAQDLQKQLTMYVERLRFAEQEAMQAQSNAFEKTKLAKEAEAQLKQLQDEVRRKDDVLQQLQVELQQQRTEQLTATAAAAGTAQQLGAGNSMQGFCSPPAATGVKGAGSCGRKRKDGAPAGGGGALGLSSAAAKAAGMAHTTPQQQLRQQQMAQLLGVAPASSVSFDLDMYDVDGDEYQQQEQQQQQQQEPSQQPAHSSEARTAGLTPPAAAAWPAAGGAEQPRQQEQQQRQQQVPSQQPDAAPASADAMAAQQQQQACLSNSFSSKLIPALQQVQTTTPRLSQLLWSTCQPAIQQLLQPLPCQLLGLNSILAAAATAAGGSSKGSGSSSSNISQQVPAALCAAQEQLNLLTAGAVSSGSALLLRLLQLGAVLVPDGPLSVSSSDATGSSSEAAAAMQAASLAVSDQGRAARWLLLPAQQSDAGGVSGSGSQHEQQQQQQVGQFLVFRSAPDPSVLHVLPLNMAVAVMQLMQHLVCLDGTCLSILAAELGSSTSSGSQASSLQRQPSSSGGVLQPGGASGSPASDSGSSSSRVRIEWGPQGPAAGSTSAAGSAQQAVTQHVQQQLRHSSGDRVQNCQGVYSNAGLQAAALSKLCSGTGSLHQQQQHQQRSLGLLLGHAARSHGLLLQQVGALLAAVAAELPVGHQPVLLNVTMADQGLLVLLLQADSCVGRSAAAGLLQHMLACPTVLAAMSAALTCSAEEQQQQQQQHHHQNGNVIMIDVQEDQLTGTALQPLNNRGNKRTAAAGSTRQGKAPPQQQGPAAAVENAHQQQQVLRAHAVQEVLMQLLECFSYGLDEGFHALQQPADQQQQPHAPAVLHAISSSNISAGSQWVSSRGSVADGQAAAAGRSAQPVQGWGAFELQRRCCAVYAGLLHSRQDALLLYSMGALATAGYGLAQRLLVMVDAACSPVGGDPFAALTPRIPGLASAVAAAAADSAGTVCGSTCSWQACLERVRLGHEGLLLLRALVATPGAVGIAAMADLSSNSTSLRLIMTTRAKLAEVTTALTAAAAAAAAKGSSTAAAAQSASSSRGSGSGSPAAAAESAVATALPLRPWAWPWSAQCGCKGKTSSSSSSGGSGGGGIGPRVVRVQHPPLQCVLQEMANTAASIHRRVMIHLRAQEAAMQP